MPNVTAQRISQAIIIIACCGCVVVFCVVGRSRGGGCEVYRMIWTNSTRAQSLSHSGGVT